MFVNMINEKSQLRTTDGYWRLEPVGLARMVKVLFRNKMTPLPFNTLHDSAFVLYTNRDNPCATMTHCKHED